MSDWMQHEETSPSSPKGLQCPQMRWQQGFARVCIVLDGLILLICFIVRESPLSIAALICLAVPWIIYGIGVYIADGFRNSK